MLANAYTAVLWHLGADPDRLYYMADARFAQMLTGCALAAALFAAPRPRPAAPAGVRPRRGRRVGAARIAVVALVGSRYDAWYWSGGMQLVGVGAAVVIGHLAVHRDSRLSAALRWGPLPTLGVWSYGIYLWHLPLIRLAQPVLRRDAGRRDARRARRDPGRRRVVPLRRAAAAAPPHAAPALEPAGRGRRRAPAEPELSRAA